MPNPTQKTCRKCGATKPLDEFAPSRTCKDGRRGTCRACRFRGGTKPASPKVCPGCGIEKSPAEFGKNSHAADGLQSRCRPCTAVLKAASHQRNREKNLVRSKAGYQSNRELRIAQANAWKRAHPDKVREYGRIYRERNPGRDLEDTRRWIAANPERAAENFRRNTLRRRARLVGATIGPVDLQALWTGTCPLCGDTMDRTINYPDPLSASVDHIVPLSLGGTHEQANLQWTHLVCNIRKGAKAP